MPREVAISPPTEPCIQAMIFDNLITKLNPNLERRCIMAIFRALRAVLFRHFATARAIQGGSGHYNEQCHPMTYG
jgi:hypothetical protein